MAEARAFRDMRRADAREVLKAFIAARPADVERLRERLAGEVLDLGRDSLRPVGTWLIAEGRRSDAAAEDSSPWWAPFHPAWIDQLGAHGAGCATLASSYFFACVERARPDARWRLARRNNEPELEVLGRGDISYAVPLAVARRMIVGDGTEGGPEDLRNVYDRWLGLDPEHEELRRLLSEPLPDFLVYAVTEAESTHAVAFSDVLAHRRSGAISRLADELAAHDAVEFAVQEDREMLLVRAPTLSVADLDAIVGRLWARAT